MNTPAPVNLDMLLETANGDATFAGELADLYLAHTAEQLALMRAALGAGSGPRVMSIAHRCKGGSMACGVVALGALFKQLEGLARDGRLQEAEDLNLRIVDEFSRVQTALHALPLRLDASGRLL